MRMLTDAGIRRLQARGKRYQEQDGAGLSLEVMTTGEKFWRMRVVVKGKEYRRSLGKYPIVGLKDARAMRDEIRRNIPHPTITDPAKVGVLMRAEVPGVHLRPPRRTAESRMGGDRPRTGRMENPPREDENYPPSHSSALAAGHCRAPRTDTAHRRLPVAFPLDSNERLSHVGHDGERRHPAHGVRQRRIHRARIPIHGQHHPQRAAVEQRLDRTSARASRKRLHPRGNISTIEHI